MHIPTNTTIYTDAVGKEETRTIMRAESVAIHTALSTFSTHNWIGIFTDSLSAKHYHHHRLMLDIITDLLKTR